MYAPDTRRQIKHPARSNYNAGAASAITTNSIGNALRARCGEETAPGDAVVGNSRDSRTNAARGEAIDPAASVRPTMLRSQMEVCSRIAAQDTRMRAHFTSRARPL